MSELKDRLKRQIKRRNKEIRINGFAKKRTVNSISKTRILIKMHKLNKLNIDDTIKPLVCSHEWKRNPIMLDQQYCDKCPEKRLIP